ncbi:hypothetical protein [Capnocytophaga cynodegmi]|uniref:Lipoprotein n=1 Tax=Capnocytophaga cynodegmi TaxID=28189 RepID=A0A0B7HKP3_9FLAO|nr:hypothetical protein [Capnocytophaga cynodegmi]CEN33860.1 conserved exported hypothetical protein [Capnocytophaga cynodegmi]CEN40311.1 conserved exported hypothetical protein [Capnocytophaga cynodegmi]
MKKFIKTLKTGILAFVTVTLVSCEKDAPAPIDERNDKGHDEWSKVTFTIRRGHLHGQNFHANPENLLYPTQEFIFETDGTNIVRKNKAGKVLAQGEEPILMISGGQYAMEIIYYNAKGERMNKEFTNSEMLPIHQHFFTVKDYLNTKTNQTSSETSELISYVYRDTNPEDVMLGSFIDKRNSTKKSELSNDALGLKGYFTPNIPYAKFDLRVRLLHVQRGTKYINNDKSKGSYPFNAPSDDLLVRSGTDFDQYFPVHVLTSPSSGEEGDYDRFVKDLADYFKKTTDEIKQILRESNEQQENSNYWM